MRDVIQARRGLQVALGLIWLLDAALQFQPFMFGRGFATQIIEPAAAGNPALVARPLLWSAHLMAAHPVACDAAFAAVQLAIAAGILLPRTVRPALAVSVAWALGVWWLGEGLGGTLSGASPLAGAPGAVILYALIAVLLWPRSEPGSRAALGPRAAWTVLWGFLAVGLLLPANRAPGAVSGQLAAAGAGEPGWIGSFEHGLASVTAGHGLAVSLALAALCWLTALGVWDDTLTRPALILAGLLGVLFWIAQAFGGLATGMATDPNSGPLLVLLAACYWPAAPPRAGRVVPAPISVTGCRSA
jgi:hypothetical protein